MTKKELMEKLGNPVLEIIKSEGLIADIHKIYDGNWIKFNQDFSHYIGTQMTPLELSFVSNMCQLGEEEKDLASALIDILLKSSELYYSSEENKNNKPKKEKK